MFEKAVREKVRWHGHRGLCSAEDLWDLDLEDLDGIYKRLCRAAKAQEEESLLEQVTEADKVLALKTGIVKRVVEVKLAEAEARKNEALRAIRKQRLLGILADKQDENLLAQSEEELQDLIDELTN